MDILTESNSWQHAEKDNTQIGTFGFFDLQAKRKKTKDLIFIA
jgi:hypothetical protein